MFRQAKILYLLAVVGLLVVLAMVDLFAPVLHARSLRQRLHAEMLALHALVVQQRDLQRQAQMHFSRLLADDADLLARLDEIDIDRDAQDLAAELSGASARATAITGFTPASLTLMGADGSVLIEAASGGIAAMGDGATPVAPLSPERPSLLVDGQGIISVARLPLRSRDATAATSSALTVVTTQELRADDLADALTAISPGLSFGLGLFVEAPAHRRAELLSASFADPAGRRTVDALLSGIASAGPPDEPGPTHPSVEFDDSGDRLYGLLADWLPRDAPVDARPVGVVLLVDGGELPADLASFVMANLESLRASTRLWLTLALGLLILVTGIVLFEFEGRRYRRAINLLEYQLERLSSASTAPPGPAAGRDTTGGAAAVTFDQLAVASDGDDNGRLDADRRQLWEWWRAEKERNGEPAGDDTFEPFRDHLDELEADLRAQHGCRHVRFEPAVVEGNVVVLATPVL